ncbi:MAG TPA: aldo/keto reductase [Xanthobacteraceae bacterium]|nr:aldo/keto reductase [Xanthobacteraceae bacterium]
MVDTHIPTLTARGAEMPSIGFGTSGLAGPVGEIVAHALTCGFRHLDAARKYGTEEGVGEGIRAAKVPRAELFITTKVSHENLHAADFARSVEQSLRALGVDHVDLLLVHWPNAAIPIAETMTALAKAKRDGLTRHVGVANFNIAMVDEAARLCAEPLVALQAEFHPYLDQSKLLAALRQREMLFIGYCPLGRGRLVNDPVVGEIARAKAKTIAQVALRWSIQQGVAPIPRSSNRQRIAENLAVFDFTLSDDEMRRIAALERPDGRIANPAGRAPAWD